jgi:hypothetical protein
MNGLRKLASNVRKTSVKRWNRMRKTEIIELEQKKNHKRREVGIAFEIQAENKRFKNEQFMNNNKAELRLRISIKMF